MPPDEAGLPVKRDAASPSTSQTPVGEVTICVATEKAAHGLVPCELSHPLIERDHGGESRTLGSGRAAALPMNAQGIAEKARRNRRCGHHSGPAQPSHSLPRPQGDGPRHPRPYGAASLVRLRRAQRTDHGQAQSHAQLLGCCRHRVQYADAQKSQPRVTARGYHRRMVLGEKAAARLRLAKHAIPICNIAFTG